MLQNRFEIDKKKRESRLRYQISKKIHLRQYILSVSRQSVEVHQIQVLMFERMGNRAK